MERFRKEGPEIPVVCCTSHSCAWVSLDCMVEVGEFERVTQEEDRSVVTYQIPVAGVSVEFHGKASDVSFRIGRASFSGYCRKPYETFGLLSDFRENRCSGPFGDVMGDGECSVGS